MEVKIKRLHPDAVIPCYAKAGDAGMDLTATSIKIDEYGNVCYGTGLAFEIPEGYVGLVFPRSSNCKKDIVLTNCVGVIDSGYRGEVSFKFKPLPHHADVLYDRIGEILVNPSYDTKIFKIGDRIGQMIIMPYPQIEFVEVDDLSSTDRGQGGYGSTGR
jgi:dUTP pyrophosphatase